MNSFYLDKNKAFYDFLETQLQLFKGHFMVTRASKDEEAIHQMRVAIKRIRTIQKFKKNIDFPLEIPVSLNETIKTIFTTAGKLRDLQIETTMLKQYKKELKSPFSELENHLTENNVMLNESLDSTLREIDLSQIDTLTGQQGQMNETGYQTDIEKECLGFVTRKIEKINPLLNLLSNEGKVHELRKQVKQLFFILQFLSEQFEGNIFFGYDLKNLKKLADTIGFWNDQDFFGQMVVKFISSKEEGFVENHPEYLILIYVIENEKQKLLFDIDLELYLEIINLSVKLDKELYGTDSMHKVTEPFSLPVATLPVHNPDFQDEKLSEDSMTVLK